MVHLNMFHKDVVSNDVKLDEVKDDIKLDEVKDDVKLDVKPVVVEIDVGQYFRNEQLFTAREHMLHWVHMKAVKLRFDIIIGRPDNGLNRR